MTGAMEIEDANHQLIEVAVQLLEEIDDITVGVPKEDPAHAPLAELERNARTALLGGVLKAFGLTEHAYLLKKSILDGAGAKRH